MRYLLDTNICIFFLRGKLKLDEIIKEKGIANFFISEVTVFELRYGAENSANPNKSHAVLNVFLHGISIIPIFGTLGLYAKEKVRLRRIGKPINDEFDLLIGVTAVENNLILITENVSDFKQIDGINIENWFERK